MLALVLAAAAVDVVDESERGESEEEPTPLSDAMLLAEFDLLAMLLSIKLL